MNNTSRYTGWYSNSGISYGDYLQTQQFEQSIRYGIDDQTKQIIASNEQLSRDNYQIMGQVNDGISSGFTNLSVDVEQLTSAVNDLSRVFSWGFSQALISLGRMNDSLVELAKYAKSPAQTWAYEQFEIARDEFKRGLYQESLDSVMKAINGYGSNPGYKTDFRFYFLQGTIQLGDFNNSDPTIINPSDAESAFLKAVRYAGSEMPLEVAYAYLCAGRAAFVQKKAKDALKYSNEAIRLDPKLVEAYFQSSQAHCVLGRPKAGLPHLVDAISKNYEYSVKAASDADICRYPRMLEEALITAKDNYSKTYTDDKKNYKLTFSKVKNAEVGGYSVKDLCAKQIANAIKYEKEFDAEASQDTIFGYAQASILAQKVDDVINPIAAAFKEESSRQLITKIQKIRQRVSEVNSEIDETKNAITDISNGKVTSKPEKLDTIDWVVGTPFTIYIAWTLYLLAFPNGIFADGNSFFFALILAILVIYLSSWGVMYVLIATIPYIIYLMRRLLWIPVARNAELNKKELQNVIDEKTEKWNKLNEKVSEAQSIKSYVEDYTISLNNSIAKPDISSDSISSTEVVHVNKEVLEIGSIYTGKVVNIREFGAFVNILPGIDGLLHIGELSDKHVENVKDYINLGQTINVKIIDIDDRGRIRLSTKGLNI